MHTADSDRRRRTAQHPLSALAVVFALLALMGGTALAEEPVVPGDDAGVIDPGAVLPDPAPVPEPAPVPVEPVATPEPVPPPPVAEPAPVSEPVATPEPVAAPAPEPAPAPVDPEPADPTAAAPSAPLAPPTRDPAITPEPGPAAPPVDAAGNPVGTVVGPAPVPVPAPAIELPPPAPAPAPGPELIELPPVLAAATPTTAVIDLPTPAPAPIALPAKGLVPHVVAPKPVEFAPIAIEPEPVNPLVAAEASAQLSSPEAAGESVFGGLVAVAEEATATAAPLAAPVTAFLPDVLPIEDVAPTGLLERLASFVLPVDGSSNAILVALFQIGFLLALALSIGRPRPQSSPLRATAVRPLFGYRAVVFRPG